MKDLLRDRIIPELSARAPYFSIRAIHAALEMVRCPLEPVTLNRYMHELTEAQFTYDAGRGWYSNLSATFALDTKPVADLAALLQEQFPFLKFACWSTDQVRPFMQHLLARNIQFVSAESHTLASIAEFLESSGFTIYVDPAKAEARRHGQFKERTVLLRPSHSKEPSAHPFARIEKLLVDLREEVDYLRLIDVSEYHHLLNEAVRQGRVQMAALLSYAQAKRITLAELFGDVESTISTEFKNAELID